MRHMRHMWLCVYMQCVAHAQIIKEVPVYIKVDPIEWEARHGLKAGVAVQSTAHAARCVCVCV